MQVRMMSVVAAAAEDVAKRLRVVGEGDGEELAPPPTGTKRKVDEASLSDEQRFNKRFNQLSLGTEASGRSNNYNNYYIPISTTDTSHHATARETKHNDVVVTAARAPPPSHGDDSTMHVDDTRHRVYISDLDEELAETEQQQTEERLIFLPDIERRFTKIPQQVLNPRNNEDDDDRDCQELVLYSIPKSHTVDEGHDFVRKAILETRARARDKVAREMRQQEMPAQSIVSEDSTANRVGQGDQIGNNTPLGFESDPDAMDVD